MKRALTLALLLATMLFVASCGGSDTGRADRAVPTEPPRPQADPAPETTPRNTTPERAPSGAAKGEQGATPEDNASSGLRVTTLGGEEVRLGGQGDVTALFFMAGW